jgi:GT2 family glycosyltransferase
MLGLPSRFNRRDASGYAFMTEPATNHVAEAAEPPWLSVVMPVYNGDQFLAAALESVVAQGDAVRGIEIIAVDDGSIDRSGGILEDFGRRLPLRVVRPGRLGNWVAATNRGLSECRAPWCCFLHQDDRWLPGRLAAVSQAIADYPHASLVVHPSWFIDSRGKRVGRWRTPFGSREGLIDGRGVWERLLVQNSLAINAPVFRTARVLETGGLDEALTYTADWDLWLRLAEAGPAAHCGIPLGEFRIHGEAQTAACLPETMRRELEKVFDQHRLGHGGWPRASGPVEAAGRYSIEVNVALAGWFHGGRPPWLRLIADWLRLGPAGWRRYLRDSRIIDRVGARLRARLASRRATARDQPAATSTEGSSVGSVRG